MTLLSYPLQCIVFDDDDDDDDDDDAEEKDLKRSQKTDQNDKQGHQVLQQQQQQQQQPLTQLLLPYQYANTSSLLSYSTQWRLLCHPVLNQHHPENTGGENDTTGSCGESSDRCNIQKRKFTSVSQSTMDRTTTPLIVYGLTFHIPDNPGPPWNSPLYLIACTSQGEMIIWDINRTNTGSRADRKNTSRKITTDDDIDDDDDDNGTSHFTTSVNTTVSSTFSSSPTRRNTNNLQPPPFMRSTTPWSMIIDDDDEEEDVQVEHVHHQHPDQMIPRMKESFEPPPQQQQHLPTVSLSPMASKNSNVTNRPILRLQLQYSHDNHEITGHRNSVVLYHCQMLTTTTTATISNDTHLMVSGDHGVAMFDWNQDILPLLSNKKGNPTNKRIVPFRHYRTYPTMPLQSNNATRWRGNCIPMTSALAKTMSQPRCAEVNHAVMTVDDKGVPFLYGIANDTFGCYKWNVDTCQVVTTYTIPLPQTRGIGHFNNLYTMILNHATKELLIGGEDGQLQIWDTKTDQCLDVVSVQTVVGVSASNNNNNSILQKRGPNRGRPNITQHQSTTTQPLLFISTCTIWNEQWWIIGGGFHHHNSLSSFSPSPTSLEHSNGYIAIIHGISRSILSFITTPYKVQQLALFNSGTSSSTNSPEPKHLMALTNTNYIYSWTDPLSPTEAAVVPQKVWCHTPSAYTIATINHSGNPNLFAVGGVGATIDMYQGDMQQYMKLSTKI